MSVIRTVGAGIWEFRPLAQCWMFACKRAIPLVLLFGLQLFLYEISGPIAA